MNRWQLTETKKIGKGKEGNMLTLKANNLKKS